MGVRQQLEQVIINSAQELKIDAGSGCFDEQTLVDFQDSWYALGKYYKDYQHNDTDIAVEVVYRYLETTNRFFGIWKDSNLSESCRARAVEALQELEAYMQGIMESVERRIYPNGRT